LGRNDREKLSSLRFSFNVKLKSPSLKWRIIEYTGNISSDIISKKVSLKRVESVPNHFLSQGFKRDRFQVVLVWGNLIRLLPTKPEELKIEKSKL